LRLPNVLLSGQASDAERMMVAQEGSFLELHYYYFTEFAFCSLQERDI